MFICLDCGSTFTHPQHFIERHGFDYGPFEERDGCPKCGGACTEAYKCDCCGNFIDDTYIKTDDGNRYCLDCYQVIHLGDE